MKDTLFVLVQRLLLNNKILFDKKELSFQIQSHPSYPSLHAVTGVLDHFNIENVAADVPATSETLAQLPESFLGQVMTDYGKDLVVVTKGKDGANYTIFSANSKREAIPEVDFIKKFTGIIVAVEKEDQQVTQSSGAKDIVLYSVLALSLITILIFQQPLISSLGHVILSLIGIVISLVILKQENGETTTLGNAFCSGHTEKKDCDAVLTSKGAEPFKGHKLSDLSLIFFCGLTMSSFLLMTSFSVLHYISVLVLPITLYSIYYQYAVVKKWCLLCLSIVGILWLQAAISSVEVLEMPTIIVSNLVIVLLSFTVVYSIWNYLKPIFIAQKNLQKDKIAYVKFKRNYALFDSLLQKSSPLNTKIDSSQEINFGNPASNLEIVVVTNPFCGHCKPVHTLIENILARYGNLTKIVVRFNLSTENLESNGLKIASRLIELFNEKGAKVAMEAMHDIYNGQEVNVWLQHWGRTENFERYVEVLKVEKQWCTANGINFTPEILINGRSFPKEYERSDLLFFIEDLEEQNRSVFTHSY